MEAMGKAKRVFRVSALSALTVAVKALPGSFYPQVAPPLLKALEAARQTKTEVEHDASQSLVYHNCPPCRAL